MSRTNEEHVRTEGFLKRVRPQEPSAELKAQVLRAARDAWHDASAGIPWRIPLRRLVVSAAAAAVLISLANLYGDCASIRPATQVLTSGSAEPCDLDIMTDPQMSFMRYAVRAGRPARPEASLLADYLEMVCETLTETEGGDGSDEPAERRSRLFPNLLSRHS